MFNDSPLLKEVAACVHEQVRNDRKAERFRAMIRETAEDSIARSGRDGMSFEDYLDVNDPGWRTGTDSVSQFHKKKADESPGGVMELPDPAIAPNSVTPLNRMYATLAAIHDVACPCKFRLHPWPRVTQRKDASEGERFEFELAVWYTKLKDDVRSLTNGHRPGLERALDAVTADLEEHCGGQGDHSTSGGEKKGGVLGLLHEQYVAPIIVGIVLLVIVGVAYWKWPWIKELLG